MVLHATTSPSAAATSASDAAAPTPDAAVDAETRVLDEASRLFYERGIQAVGMDAIRDASGVSLKRLYRLFPAKEHLVEATLRHREAGVREQMARATAGGAPPAQRILAIFDLLRDWFDAPGYRGCAYINAYGELSAGSRLVANAVEQHKALWRELLGHLVAEAGGPPRLADQLAILVNGAMVMAAILRSPAPADDARAAAELLLRETLPAPPAV